MAPDGMQDATAAPTTAQMTAQMTAAGLVAVLAVAGFRVTEAQAQEMLAAHGHLERMKARGVRPSASAPTRPIISVAPDDDRSQRPVHRERGTVLRTKRLSPVELTEACLARIAHDDPRLDAFITVTGERARAEAHTAEDEIAAGHWRGPLHGIPIGLKDVFATKGVATTAHSRQLLDHVPAQDLAVAGFLEEAGAILLGKLACHEFAFGAPAWDLPWPPARNPWNPEHFTGGSSSGVAAAVAAGLILGGIGSDTSGSVRSPAALCGIAGLKPTYDLIDRRGLFPLASSLDHVGLMGRTVEDCAILLQALAPRERARAPVAGVIALDTDIKGLRIGVVRHFFREDAPITDAGARAIDAALDVFRDLGCAVRDVLLPPLADWMAWDS